MGVVVIVVFAVCELGCNVRPVISRQICNVYFVI